MRRPRMAPGGRQVRGCRTESAVQAASGQKPDAKAQLPCWSAGLGHWQEAAVTFSSSVLSREREVEEMSFLSLSSFRGKK